MTYSNPLWERDERALDRMSAAFAGIAMDRAHHNEVMAVLDDLKKANDNCEVFMKRYNNMRDHYVRAESAREEAFNIIEEHLHEMSITREDALRRLNDARAKGEEEQRQGLFFKRKMQEIRKMQETQPT